MILWVAVAVLMAAEPAQGSASGGWAYGDVSGSFGVDPVRVPVAFEPTFGAGTAVVAGWGFDVGHVRLVPSVRGSFHGAVAPTKRDVVTRFVPALDIAFSATNLLHEVHTGLRFSPVVGFGHSALGQGGWLPETVVRAGFALEQRFGPMEIAWRPQGIHYFSASQCRGAGICLDPKWELAQTLFIEGWALPNLSFALGPWWRVVWGSQYGLVGTPYYPYPPQHLLGARGLVTWAPWSFGGFGLDVSYTRTLQWNGLTYSQDFLVGVLSMWFRTDGQIQRNWLER